MFLLRLLNKRKRQDSHADKSEKKDKYIYVAGPRGNLKSELIKLIKDANLPCEDLDIPVTRWDAWCDSNGQETSVKTVFPPISLLKENAKFILHVLESDEGVCEAIKDIKTYNGVLIVKTKWIQAVYDALKAGKSSYPILCGHESDFVINKIRQLFEM